MSARLTELLNGSAAATALGVASRSGRGPESGAPGPPFLVTWCSDSLSGQQGLLPMLSTAEPSSRGRTGPGL